MECSAEQVASNWRQNLRVPRLPHPEPGCLHDLCAHNPWVRRVPCRTSQTNSRGSVQSLATHHGWPIQRDDRRYAVVFFFAKDLSPGIDISGINMIRKAARFRVAARSGNLATGTDVIEEVRNSQLALLSVLGHEWRAQWIEVSMCTSVQYACRLISAMGRRGSLTNVPHRRTQPLSLFYATKHARSIWRKISRCASVHGPANTASGVPSQVSEQVGLPGRALSYLPSEFFAMKYAPRQGTEVSEEHDGLFRLGCHRQNNCRHYNQCPGVCGAHTRNFHALV